MIKQQFIFLILLTFLFSNFGRAQNLESKIDNLYQVKEESPGFSIAVFKRNDIIFEKQYGNSNLDYNIPITSKTVFDIGSIAKQFTAAAILLLEHQGKLSIKDPAYKYIDNLPRYRKGDPTIEQLLNQTSGIMEVDPYFYLTGVSWYDLLTQSRITNIIFNIGELNFKPGTYFQYTNANYILLANIIEKASGKAFKEYLQEQIFSPLKMEHTYKKYSTYSTIKNRALGYVEDEGEYYKTDLYGAIYNGDGQIMTTPRDMIKWHKGIRNAKIGTPELWKKMHTKSKLNDGTVIDFGLGVEFETHNGYEAMGFDGMIMGGFVSKYLYFPQLDMLFFTTQNTFDSDFEETFFQLVDLYIPKKVEKNNRTQETEHIVVSLNKTELKKYEGKYIFLGDEYEDIKANTIQLKGNKLVLITADGDNLGNLEPIGNHKFLFDDIVIKFNIENNNKHYQFYANENEKPWLFKSFEPYNYFEKELKEFEGIYLNKNLQIANEIKIENGKLWLYFSQGTKKVELQAIAKELFKIPNYPIQFKRNNDGRIIGLKIMELSFEKI